eukprot:579678-Prorocentrum_minimum.AAC.1
MCHASCGEDDSAPAADIHIRCYDGRRTLEIGGGECDRRWWLPRWFDLILRRGLGYYGGLPCP